MTYEVVWSDEAFRAAQAFMVDDPSGLAEVFDVVDELAFMPRPPSAMAWGGTDLVRLPVGRYRVLYEIDDQIVTIDVLDGHRPDRCATHTLDPC